MITTLGGGVGAGKFLEGLYSEVNKETLNVIVNTADDFDIFNVRVSPDVDSVLHWLSGRINRKQGWGIRNDSFFHLIGSDNSWFKLGDQDLEENIKKMNLIKRGLSLEEVIERQRKRLGIKKAKILPMTNDKVETYIFSEGKKIHFQEYLIKHKMRPKIERVFFSNIKKSKPPDSMLNLIAESRIIIFCPSNPIISIDPILAVPGVKSAIRKSKAIKVAISPIVSSKAFKGPVLKFMKFKNLKQSALGVAEFYTGLADYLMIDTLDSKLVSGISALGLKPIIKNIKMSNKSVSKGMARDILNISA
jgi:LPPG:FO 2-phospho-L-lactate transferase